MDTRRRHQRLLDAGTVILLVGAAAVAARGRLPTAWRSSRVVEVGQTVPRELRLAGLATGDTITASASMPTLLLFFRSDCAACDRTLPAWRRLLARAGPRLRPLAVGLEPPPAALAWVRSELPDALAVRPLEPDDLLERLAVRRVPATLLIGPRGRLLYRRTGVLAAGEVDSVRALAGPRAPPER